MSGAVRAGRGPGRMLHCMELFAPVDLERIPRPLFVLPLARKQ